MRNLSSRGISQAEVHSLGEAFIPHGTPYLGQTDVGEPIRRCNVLSPDRRPS